MLAAGLLAGLGGGAAIGWLLSRWRRRDPDEAAALAEVTGDHAAPTTLAEVTGRADKPATLAEVTGRADDSAESTEAAKPTEAATPAEPVAATR
ncbi:hypothetical protein AB0B85_27255 [Micromonospora sp. NPDC049044]|uniref:hypothetical protein n=1 Tax=Micromonospora sp. NPDC049044 TaxID=3154827 RepID=UPI0033D33FB0